MAGQSLPEKQQGFASRAFCLSWETIGRLAMKLKYKTLAAPALTLVLAACGGGAPTPQQHHLKEATAQTNSYTVGGGSITLP